MTNIAIELEKAIIARNYSTSSHLLNRILDEKLFEEVSRSFEKLNTQFTHPTLELRDHVMYFLGLWVLYFVVEIPSIELLLLISKEKKQSDIEVQTLKFVRELLEKNDSRLDQSYINIETISQTQYAVILPQILTMRSEELENCIIPFKTQPTSQYCVHNLLKTYYGKKIVTATLSDQLLDAVVGQKVFDKIAEALQSAGLDVKSMLQETDTHEWSEIICQLSEQHASEIESQELRVLYRVKAARSEIFLDNFRKQVAALDTILNSKTQLCNDVLLAIASNRINPMRRRAINALGQTGDSTTIEFLSRIMNDSDEGTRIEAVRSYSLLASQSKWSITKHELPQSQREVPLLNIKKINQLLNTLITKGMPQAIFDDTIAAMVMQDSPHAVDVLKKLLTKPQPQIRIAVIKASRQLERQIAAQIIRKALNDDDSNVVTLAEKELDNRWSDEVW